MNGPGAVPDRIPGARSRAGAYFYGEGAECYSPAAKGVNVVDTTAAGDSFIGGFVYAVTSGMSVFLKAWWYITLRSESPFALAVGI